MTVLRPRFRRFIFFAGILFFWFLSAAWALIQCPRCGHVNEDKDRYCLRCAAEIRPASPAKREKARAVSRDASDEKTGIPTWAIVSAIVGGLLLVIFIDNRIQARIEAKKRRKKELTKTNIFLSVSSEMSQGDFHAARRFERYEIDLPMEYRIEGFDRVPARLTDLARGGVGFLAPEPLEKDDRISVFLKRPGAAEMKFGGIVTSCRAEVPEKEYFVGVQFFHLFSEQEGFIEDLIREHARKKEEQEEE
jgi:hypothetical protein